MINRATYIRQLKKIATQALSADNITSAIRAYELIGKTSGLFTPISSQKLTLQEMSDDDVSDLISQLKANNNK